MRSEPSGPTIYPAQHAVVIDPGTTDIAEPIGNIGVGDPTVGRVVGNTPGPPPTVPTTQATVVTPAVEPAAKPVPLSSTVLASKLITKVVPQYPSAARAVHVSGLVRLLALIGVDGHVKSLRVMEGHPLLRKAAEDAVSQWIYSPTTLNGRPVEVEASIEVNFTLNN